jgi:hypothetical protein
MTNYDSDELDQNQTEQEIEDQKAKQDDSQDYFRLDTVDSQEELAEGAAPRRSRYILSVLVVVAAVLVLVVSTVVIPAANFDSSQNATATAAAATETAVSATNAQATAAALDFQATQTGVAAIIASQTSLAASASPTDTPTDIPTDTPTRTPTPTITPTPPLQESWSVGSTLGVRSPGTVEMREAPSESAEIVRRGGLFLVVVTYDSARDYVVLDNETNQWWWHVSNSQIEAAGWVRQSELTLRSGTNGSGDTTSGTCGDRICTAGESVTCPIDCNPP